MRFQVFIAACMKMITLWAIPPCSVAKVYRSYVSINRAINHYSS
jgi:hypothetical protein